MTTDTVSTPGTFVWYDLLTTDRAKSVSFYARLLGWTSQAVPTPGGEYNMFSRGNRPVGGLISRGADQGLPPGWIPCVRVDDLDLTLRRAQDLRGAVAVPSTDVPGMGRFAVLRDPLGAILSAFQASGRMGKEMTGQATTAGPGTFRWTELVTPTPKMAASFYEGLLGWKSTPGHAGAHGNYWVYKYNSRDVAGMWKKPSGVDFPSHWLLYIEVQDVDEATQRAAELGAEVLRRPSDIEREGRFSLLRDPMGAVVALFRGF
jgi:uncharacterized protein